MWIRLRVALAAVFAACGTAVAGIETWRVHEFALTSAKDYAAGGGDAVALDVEFSNRKTGEKIVRPGFWDGGATFRVRFAPTSVGPWVWRAKCKEEPSLDGKMGGFLADAYSGDLALYRHGFVRVRPGDRHFTHADGTPFLYLGAAHWNLYSEPFEGENALAGVLRRRAAQGFTVVQSAPEGVSFDLKDGKVDAADLEGLRLVDRYFQAVADAGLVHANANLFAASDMGREIASDWAALARLGRYWAARFGAYPVMWTLAREIDNDCYAEKGKGCFNYSSNPWVRVANALHAADGYGHPLSGHQEDATHTTTSGEGTSADGRTGNGRSAFYEERVAKKAGHCWWAARWRPTPGTSVDWGVPRDYRATTRAAVNFDGRDDARTRDLAVRGPVWVSFLSGFCGYGGVVDEASARYATLLKSYLEALPWWGLVPDLGEGRIFIPDEGTVCSCAAKDDELYLFYFGGAGTATGNLKGFDSRHAYSCQWFNPRKGEYRTKTTLPGAVGVEIPLPKKPDAKDWVLCVRKLAAGAPKAVVNKASARARGLLDWNRAKAICKGVKLITLVEEVDTPLESGDVFAMRQAEERFGRIFRGKRQMKSYVVRVDLGLPGLAFAATGRDPKWGEPLPEDPEGKNRDLEICTQRRTTGEFMAQAAGKRMDGGRSRPLIGFNTSVWGPWPEQNHPYATLSGLAISEGVLLKDAYKAPKAAFVVWKDGTLDVTGDFPMARTNEVWIAHAGRDMILTAGQAQDPDPGSTAAKMLPRLALGLSKDRDFLYLLAIDAHRPGVSMGGTAHDMVRIFRAAGAWDAVDFDGYNAQLCEWDRHKGTGTPINSTAGKRVGLNIVLTQDLSKKKK